ncbi:MAG: hypothetical protein WD826_03055, partial [Actinomycetota bacterium]
LHLEHEIPSDAVNLNVEGRRVAGVAGGFGKMWQKTYSVRIAGTNVTPERVIKTWKEHFPDFWPKNARFFGPMASVTPGDVALLNLKGPGGVKLSTGIIVVYADDTSFSFMSPEGHMFNGMITFSARPDEGAVVAQAQMMIRAQDPLYELGMTFGGHGKEDKHWTYTLEHLAKSFGADVKATAERTVVDKRRQWKHFGNITRSAAIRSGMYAMGAPFRAIAKPFKRRA